MRGWFERTSPEFTFALKFPREITHDLRLELPAAESTTREFLRLAALLEHKRGPLLLQLPPSFGPSGGAERTLCRFLDLVEDARLAVELRHPDWIPRADLLRERNIAWVLVDGAQPNHRAVLFTADFTYVRWNRSGLPFSGWREVQHDRSDDLDWWAATLRAVPAATETVYGYMSNEFAGHAPTTLRMLCQRLGLPAIDPRSRWAQGVLF